ncbi:serine hydrolase domain-containing protein [Streptomyces sp. NPDC051183]|uniref:serine hydrolase domain-containing protein n=1 Tax=unclassified Streptomyces TaxID=2593676 RepID=UPI0034165B19
MTRIRTSAPAARSRSGAPRRSFVLGALTVAVLTTALAAPGATAWAQPHHQPQSSSPAGDSARARTQKALDEIVRIEGVVGAQATLVNGNQRTSLSSGTAERGTDRPMPEQGYFRMGSNTKTFVATVVLQLVGEGRIRLEDKVEKHLPGLVRGNGNDGRKITVRQLLQHTSGLPDYAPRLPVISGEEQFREHRFDQYSSRELVAMALKDRPVSEPGRTFSYSNTGYILAGMIIEKVTGRPWSEEVHDRIIDPLRLRHTFSQGGDIGLPQPHAKAYMQFKPAGALVESTEVNMSWGRSAGDLITTSNDLARFWRGLLGGELLKREQLAEMQRTVPVATGGSGVTERAGLGVFWRELSCGGGSWGHGGTTLGHLNANGFTDKGKRGAIVVRSTNLAMEDRDGRTDRLIDQALCAEK